MKLRIGKTVMGTLYLSRAPCLIKVIQLTNEILFTKKKRNLSFSIKRYDIILVLMLYKRC